MERKGGGCIPPPPPPRKVARESIECFEEDDAFSWLYDLAPCPAPSPPFLISKLDRRHTERLRKEACWWQREVGEEPDHTTAREPGPLEIIQYSLGFFNSKCLMTTFPILYSPDILFCMNKLKNPSSLWRCAVYGSTRVNVAKENSVFVNK